MKEDLIVRIAKSTTSLGVEDVRFAVTQPESIEHGDYATNVALVVCKSLGISPLECAQKIIDGIDKGEVIEKLEVAGPGFINIFLKDSVVREVLTKEVGISANRFSTKRVLVEHSSPNLFKPFHIGHLMNNVVGEFVARAVKKGGAELTTLSFPSDVSLGIAKAIFIIEEDMKSGDTRFATSSGAELIDYFGDCYVRGVRLHEEKPELEEKIKDVAKDLFNQIDSGDTATTEVFEIYKKARAVNTEYFRGVVEGLGSHIDAYIYESETGKIGKEIVQANPTIFTEGEGGSRIYVPDEERKDLHTAVFVNREGHPTYEAKDLGLIEKKFANFGHVDFSFFITDNEQSQHFKIVLDAASKINDIWKERALKSIHVPHGRMLFKGEKMSSRLGGVPLAESVLEVVLEEVRTKAGEKIAHLAQDERVRLEKDIALSAVKIAILRSKPGLNINFDPDISLSFEGDSGPYLLYTHARASSLLDKAKEKGVSPSYGEFPVSSLEKELLHASETYTDAIETLSPQKIVTYLFSVAQRFNSFYAQEQIIGDDVVKTSHNLAVVRATKNVLKEGLEILGVAAPERM